MKSVKSHRYRFQDRLTSGFFCHANYTHVSPDFYGCENETMVFATGSPTDLTRFYGGCFVP
jgi:hypothetical protein